MFPHQVCEVSTRRRHHGHRDLLARGCAVRPLGSLWVLAFLVGLGSPAGPPFLGHPSLHPVRSFQENLTGHSHQVGQVNRYLRKYNIIREVHHVCSLCYYN